MNLIEAAREAELLCAWIAESPHQRGSINGKAAQVAYALRTAIAAAEKAEPVYWQWRRKDQPWRLEAHTFNIEVKATTSDSEVRALYASTAAQVPLTYEHTPMDAFENAIRRIGVVAACEWFGHAADSAFTKETQRVLDERANSIWNNKP